MSAFDTISGKASEWLDEVAAAALAFRETLRPLRFARLVERDDGEFTLEDATAEAPTPSAAAEKESAKSKAAEKARTAVGPIRIVNGAIIAQDRPALAQLLSRARVEFVLRPDRFLFRPLQLPRRASDFLEGIVRAQIDRLTPWSPAEAAFGCLPAREDAGERMRVTIAATSRRLLAPYVEAVRTLGVEAVVVSTRAPEDARRIKVFEQKIGAALDARRLKNWLAALLLGLGLIGAVSLAVSSFATNELDSRQQDINQKIARRRAAMHKGDDAMSAAALALRQRKAASPSAVIVYDALSRVLPDDAYLTEMRIEGDKAQIVGVALDPPGLIRLIELDKQFTHAVFFAPTTRLPSDAGQHFFIEAHIEPGNLRPEAPSQ